MCSATSVCSFGGAPPPALGAFGAGGHLEQHRLALIGCLGDVVVEDLAQLEAPRQVLAGAVQRGGEGVRGGQPELGLGVGQLLGGRPHGSGVGLVVGVVIGLVQALTQIQEQTLVYAPKIIAIFVSLLLFLPLMGALLGGFMRQIAARIAGM